MSSSMQSLRPDDATDSTTDDTRSRRTLLRGVGLGGAGALALVLSACGGDDDEDDSTASTPSTTSTTSTQSKAQGGGDLEIVNYALTLEYLEADFYDQVIKSGEITDKATVDLAKEIGENEQDHVDALLKTAKSLGTPAKKPKTNFDDVLAGGPDKILQTAATVENIGAAAYLGQASKIKNKEILAAALSIHSVEARHAAALNQLVGRGFTGSGATEGSIPDGPFAKPMSMQQVLKQIQPFLA